MLLPLLELAHRDCLPIIASVRIVALRVTNEAIVLQYLLQFVLLLLADEDPELI